MDLVRGTRPLTAALLVLACALPAGCGGSGTAADPAPSDAAASPSPSGPVVPALPDAARKHTKAGAVAFVRHYIDLMNHVQKTGRTAPIAGVSLPDCSSCNTTNRYVRRLYEAGGHLAGGRTIIRKVIDAQSPTLYGDYVVHIAITITPSVEFTGDGGRKPYKGGRNILSVFPMWSRGQWKVAQWTRAN